MHFWLLKNFYFDEIKYKVFSSLFLWLKSMFDYISFYYKENETNFRAVIIDNAEIKKNFICISYKTYKISFTKSEPVLL